MAGQKIQTRLSNLTTTKNPIGILEEGRRNTVNAEISLEHKAFKVRTRLSHKTTTMKVAKVPRLKTKICETDHQSRFDA